MTADAEASSLDGAEREPLVSIIIPTWNRAPMLRLTLQTVLAQDLPGGEFEVLVIGDGCTDDSETVVASCNDPRLRWHNLPENSGNQSVPNNAGLRMARGRYIAHLGHDDFWFPWHLSGLVATIDETGADWVHPLVVGLAPSGVIYCFGPPQDGIPYAEHHVPPSGWMYRRQVFEDIGGWADHRAIAWEIDFDYMRRAALAGKLFTFHPRPTVLKFPSPLFRGPYRTGDPAPIQREIFARMQHDPEALERELLLDLAILLAKVDSGGGKGVFQRVPSRPSVRQLLWWTPRRWLIAHYGMERWPIPRLLRGGAGTQVAAPPAAAPDLSDSGKDKSSRRSGGQKPTAASREERREHRRQRDERRERRRQRDERRERRRQREERVRSRSQSSPT